MQRRSAAVLSADLVGLSRLVAHSEEQTLRRLAEQRRSIIDPLLERHRGRVFKTMGDGLLVEFASAVDAVRFALAQQKQVAETEAEIAAAERLTWRIAVHLGDVVVDADDLVGDGVNVASRLQSFAPPGGVLVSQTIRDHLRGGFLIRPAGIKRLKNIPKPMQVFEVREEGEGAPVPHTDASLSSVMGRPAARVGLAVCAFALIGIGLWLGGDTLRLPTSLLGDPAPMETGEVPTTPPQILVMPFSTEEAEGREALIAGGLTDEIIGGLSKFSGIRVFGRNTSEALQKAKLSPAELRRKHGVRYVVSGAMRVLDSEFRLNFELIDTDSGSTSARRSSSGAMPKDARLRWIHVLPNGEVLVAEALQEAGALRTVFDYAMVGTMKRAAAVGISPNRITRLRDPDGDGVAEVREVFLDGLNQPFGMALLDDTFYVGNTDGVVAFPFAAETNRISGPGRTLTSFKPGGHWTRSLLPSSDGSRLYVGVGSLSNIGESGIAAEEGRAAIHEIDLASGRSRIFADGLRNPVGLAWEPRTGILWTVVNERDGLGDETPPDYLTSVQDGGFYGWPYCYWGRIVDDRVPQDPSAVARAITPDYALGGHTASLGLCWLPAGTLAGFPEGMVIGQHGSWNRSKWSGYEVVLVPFSNERPAGLPRDILTGFLAPDERTSCGRPVGVAVGPDGSLLVADDVGDVVWRVTSERQG